MIIFIMQRLAYAVYKKRGRNITYAYDRDDRRKVGTIVENETAYTYDSNGNLLTVIDSQGIYGFV